MNARGTAAGLVAVLLGGAALAWVVSADERGTGARTDDPFRMARMGRRGRRAGHAPERGDFRRARRTANLEVPQAHVVGPQTGVVGARADDADAVALLEELGYVDGVEDPEIGRVDGVQVRVPERMAPGATLLSVASEPHVVLLDDEGHELHRWTMRLTDAWPTIDPDVVPVDRTTFRRATLMPNGDLIGVWAGYGLARVDRNSQLVWGHFLPTHHDLEVREDGSVLVLTRQAKRLERFDANADVFEDFVTELAPDGSLARRWSVLEAFEAYPPFAAMFETRREQERDLLHTNSISLIREDLTAVHPAFARGNLLLSLRYLDLAAVLDGTTHQVLWHQQGPFVAQHDPQLLADGSLLVFDNLGAADGTSRVITMDPRTAAVTWSWEGAPGHPFSSSICGHAQRLPNGNTLVNSSAQGVISEVTPAGEVVWRFASAVRAGRSVARLQEVWRVPPEQLTWLTTP